ncbi:hypothetical protein MMC13_008350 [Lambiella insularis]|nr:hypothetical protein [Lambiella insularis]
MNHPGPSIPHVQPATPLYSGRRHHEAPYVPQQQYAHPYPNYHQTLPQHYHPQPPPQWYQYQNMQGPMPRPYQQYYPMVHPPYPMPHNATPMSSRPNPPQHTLSSSSMRSSHGLLSPPPPERTSQISQPVPTSVPSLELVTGLSPQPPPPAPPPAHRMPFYPPLPWLSVPDVAFPTRPLRRRRRRPPPQSSNLPVELPPRPESPAINDRLQKLPTPDAITSLLPQPLASKPVSLSVSVTPTTSKAPSEADSTQPTTPLSAIAPTIPSRLFPTVAPTSNGRIPGKALGIKPVVPNIPALPKSSKKHSISITSEINRTVDPIATVSQPPLVSTSSHVGVVDTESTESGHTSKASSPAIKNVPKSWADLVRSKAPLQPSGTNANNSLTTSSDNLNVSKAGSLSNVLSSFTVLDNEMRSKIAFIKPRGLVNTGNMCYMNAVLQILMFCAPFYMFLDQVGKQAIHSFKSDTPMLDAMVMFMHEYPVIDSAVSVEQLRLRLRDGELEQYGDAFVPEFVYEVIRRIPRFSTMRRGHQQDAEEFLGFLLEELHDECAKTMRFSASKTALPESTLDDVGKSPSSEKGNNDGNGWLEVGPKQKAAITRSSGMIDIETPITKIFGGELRSELRVPGAKPSVTLEPYQPLQLDIGSPQVNNILDALRNLTRPETLHGDFNSPRGPGIAATKQVFIETLPSVLILHLKRFQYDNAGGTQKIWKKVGYPLELEVPKEVFPQHRRGAYLAHGALPRYHLIGVVYHHGKNASGGHYTVDVRRQDGHEWIRLDDTVIRRVRSDDVAEGGSEEDPEVLAAALEQHKPDFVTSSNIFNHVMEDSDDKEQAAETGWSHVHSANPNTGSTARKSTGTINGSATPVSSSGRKPSIDRFFIKDNKVAYILFYQRL